MTIDRSSTHVTPSHTAKPGAGAKPHPTGANDPGGPASLSFLSLLTSMEPQEQAATDPLDTAAADGQLVASQLLAAPPDHADLLAQGLGRTIPVAGSDASSLVEVATAAIAAPAVLGTPAPMVRVPAGSVREAAPRSSLAKGGLEDEAHPGGTPAADLSAGPASRREGEFERKGKNMGAASAAASAAVRLGKTREAAEVAHADGRMAVPMRAAEAAVAAGALSEALASVARGSSTARASDRPLSRSLLSPAGSATAGSWAEQAMGGANAAVVTTYSIEAAAPVPEMAVAEKVEYWISRGVQKAELQLDAFGGGSVEVSISVNGNEAEVAFRSDQPEARRLLQDAMGHLRELLESQGLSLSGGFVGTSAQQEPGAGQRRSHAQQLKNVVEPAQMAATATALIASRTSGRVVDLFV